MITKLIKRNWVLVLILFLAAILRLYGLGRIPPSLDWDEAALGYNAYSILKTGRDEYGQFLPLIFKSFGDYKPGLYIYLTVPFVAIFGLTELAVRLPSAILGILSVWLIYLLTQELFQKEKLITKPASRDSFGMHLSLITAFALAISPWHLHFSRGAWEANVALFFILGGIYAFLRMEKKKIKWLYYSALSFAGAVLTYQGGKLMIPLIIFGLLICFWQKFKKFPRKELITAAALLLILSLPILLPVFTGGGGRLEVMSVFSYRRSPEEISQVLLQDKGSRFFFNLFHCEWLAFARGILGRYFNHFSGKFLFFEGDWGNQRHSVPYAGVLYYIDFIFLISGLVYLIREKIAKNFIWYWLLISPLPAALSRDAIQAVRSLNMVLPLAMIVGAGIYQVYHWLKEQKKILLITGYCLLITIYSWCFIYYLDQYYLHYPVHSSQFWQYGYREVVNFIYPIRNNYSRIIFTQKWGQPYIYWLFYSQYSPGDYQKQAQLTESPYGDVGQVEKIDNIEFRNIYWPADRGLAKTLFVGNQYELPLQDIDPKQARILEEVKFLNGEIAFRIVETY